MQNIKSWVLEDKPRYKLLQHGTSLLTTTELISIIINTGNKNHLSLELSRHLLTRYESLQELSRKAYTIVKPLLEDLNHEEFKILLLNRNNSLIKVDTISKGGVAGTVVDAKLIFKSALENLASGIILSHNHPSGSLKPSSQDLNITKKLIEAAKILDISILDHLFVSNKGYFSFKDEGLLN